MNEEFETVTYQRRRRKREYPSFEMFCDGNYSRKYGRESMDASKYLMDLTPGSDERKALDYFMHNRDKSTNIIMVRLSQDDKKKFFYKGVKQLVQNNIVKKIQNSVYMLNPFFMVPYEMDDEKAKEWDSL